MSVDSPDGIAIVIADDHAMVRGGLQRIIEAELGMRVTGQAGDGTGTLALLEHTHCDVLLLDLGMPAPSGRELITRVRTQWPKVAVLVISMHNEPRIVRDALDAGAHGYVTKDSDPEILLEAVRRVAAGGHYLEPKLAHAVLFAPAQATHGSLSPRERQVLRLLADGQSNGAIARALFLSEKTVSTHKANLMAKLGLRSMADLVHYADRHLPPGGDDAT